MPLPNFIIIGAAKSGTTTLYRLLEQHPQVYMNPVKEPHFFSSGCTGGGESRPDGKPTWRGRMPVRDLDSYYALFSGAAGEQAIGEASTSYLPSEEAPLRIAQLVPDAKLLAILRNPVDRAYSQHMHHVRDGREPLDTFEEALDAEASRMKEGWGVFWCHKRSGLYAEQLQRYYDHFDKDQIQVYLFEDLKEHPIKTVQCIFSFLEIDSSFEPGSSVQYSTTGRPRSRALHTLLGGGPANRGASLVGRFLPERLKHAIIRVRNRNLSKPELATETRRQLQDFFRTDILKLQDLIDRDLSHWLDEHPRSAR